MQGHGMPNKTHTLAMQHYKAARPSHLRGAARAPCRGLPVFTVPGLSLTVPSHRGEVRFTPLFLNRRQLDDTVSAVQNLVACSVRRAL